MFSIIFNGVQQCAVHVRSPFQLTMKYQLHGVDFHLMENLQLIIWSRS